MRSTTPSPARRSNRLATRRARRRPAIIAAGLAVGIVATAGFSVVTPISQAEASGTSPSFIRASYSTPIASAPPVTAAEPVQATTEADAALAAAATTLSASAAVTADIAASGLDVGVADTSVDTTELEAAVAELESRDSLPAPWVADSRTVTTLTASVDAEVNGLRGHLDAALALKAEQEAAEKARLEAEAAAAAAAKEAEAKAAAPSDAPSGSRPGAPATTGAVGGTSPADAQATARSMLGGYGWGDDQFGCLVSLWNRESGWNYQAHNSSSGAHGIPQALPGSKMATAGADWETNPATQIAWGLGYISGRYGSPCGAWDHSESVGWY